MQTAGILTNKITVFLGPPGAGKGTQARLLSRKLGLPLISVGEILRTLAKAETEYGKQIRQVLTSGELMSNEILADIISNRTSKRDCSAGYIIDGYPRNLIQAHYLTSHAINHRKEITAIYLAIPDSHITERVLGRQTCNECGEVFNIHLNPSHSEIFCSACGSRLAGRTDDTTNILKRRLKVFSLYTIPVIRYYENSNQLIEVDAQGEITTVFENLLESIDYEESNYTSNM